MTKIQIQTLLVTIAASLSLMATPQTSSAQIVPFYASGSHAIYSPCDGMTKGFGNTANLGDVILNGMVVPMPSKDPLAFDWLAVNFNLITENGDQIFFVGTGTVEFSPLNDRSGMHTALWTASFIVVGGTGQFSNVGPGHAPIRVFAVNEPMALPLDCPNDYWSYSWGMEGTIDLGNQKKGKSKAGFELQGF